MGAGLGQDVALLTDGRFSGGSHVSGADEGRAQHDMLLNGHHISDHMFTWRGCDMCVCHPSVVTCLLLLWLTCSCLVHPHVVSCQGFIIGHISPEAQDGGPIALLQSGDIIDITTGKGSGHNGTGGSIQARVSDKGRAAAAAAEREEGSSRTRHCTHASELMSYSMSCSVSMC